MRKTLRQANVFVLAVALAMSIALSGFAAPSSRAYGDEAADAQQVVDEAQASLDDAETNADALASESDGLEQEIVALQARIDETVLQAKKAQSEVISGRSALGDIVFYEYRGGTKESLFALLLGSENFSTLLRNLNYLGEVKKYQSDEVEAQKKRVAHFDSLINELNAQKDAQDAKLAELQAKRAEAEAAVAFANAALITAQGEAASVIAALQQKAEALEAQGGVSEPIAVEDANTTDHPAQGGSTRPNPDPAEPEAGWSTGLASAYGGSTDAWTPNPGITATGAVCDDWSMGVAVPMAWPGYWRYYGRTVEISYGGMTVLATVNDCGGMNNGERALDLQPGVWKAFGFSSCNDWGVREVNYRFL